MQNFQENIVPSLGQNSQDVFIYNNQNSKLRILFVGNSITKHAPKPSIGWNRDCGMAASSIEHDYVHLIVKKIIKILLFIIEFSNLIKNSIGTIPFLCVYFRIII